MRGVTRSLTAIAAIATVMAAAVPALAQAGDAALHAGALEVPVNKSQVVTADRTIARAMVGNPEIADVLPISERSVYVLGKTLGTTSLTLYDRTNRVIAVMDVEVGPDVEGLRTQLGQVVPGQPIEARISAGSILLSGMVTDPGAADRAAQLAKAYAGDKVINLISVGGSQQVMLEVRFSEINRQVGEDLGVNTTARSRDGSFNGGIGEGVVYQPGTVVSGSSSSSQANSSFNGSLAGNRSVVIDNLAGAVVSDQTTITGNAGLSGGLSGSAVSNTLVQSGAVALGAIRGAFGVFGKTFSIGGTDFESVLNVLERKGLAKTLAEPTLIALSGEKASFLAGGEFPVPVIQSGSNGGGSNAITVEFKPFGVSLGFTPTVLNDKVISMIIEPEVSSIDPSASITINGLVVPGLQTRRASTTVELRDGESFAIAGLLRKDFQNTVRQLPLLGSLPIIGSLFRSSNFQKGETELLIVVTPRLVKPIRPDQVRLPDDRIGDPMPHDILLNGDGHRPKALAPQVGALPAGPAGAAAATKEQGYEY